MQKILHFLTETAGDGTVVEETNKFVQWCTDNVSVFVVCAIVVLAIPFIVKGIKKLIK